MNDEQMKKMRSFLANRFRTEGIRPELEVLIVAACRLEAVLAETVDDCDTIQLETLLQACNYLDDKAHELTKRCRKLVNDRVVSVATSDFA